MQAYLLPRKSSKGYFVLKLNPVGVEGFLYSLKCTYSVQYENSYRVIMYNTHFTKKICILHLKHINV